MTRFRRNNFLSNQIEMNVGEYFSFLKLILYTLGHGGLFLKAKTKIHPVPFKNLN